VSLGRCSFCRADAVVTDGHESACPACAVLLTDAPCVCGESMPVRVVDGEPRCLGCLNFLFMQGRDLRFTATKGAA